MAIGERDSGVNVPVRLIEREAELAEIEGLLQRAAGGIGTLVVIEATAGAGKTALVQNAVHLGRARGIEVLQATGSVLERDLGFGIVRSLFERKLAEKPAAWRRALMSGAAGRAASVFLPDKTAEPTDLASAIHGLFWLVSNLAERGPLMLAVDDAHWADPPSLRFLTYLARRLTGLPVLFLVAMRPREPGGQGELLAALSGEPGGEVLTPGPLSVSGVGRLVSEMMAAQPAREFVAACHTATGGNPFLLRELIAALSADGVAPGAAAADRVSLIGPQTVSRMVLARVSRIGTDAAALTEAVAVLGGGELRQCAALAGLKRPAAARATDALSEIGVLRATRPLQFVHPLVHAALYESISTARRSLLHSTAAQLMTLDGADADRVALHLLHAEPAGDRRVVETLLAAAAAAGATGAPEQAANYLRRALREPPGLDQRAGVLHALGAAELLARNPEAAQHLAQALSATEDAGQRGAIALLLGRASVSGGRLAEARQFLEPLIEDLRATQPEVAARLEAYRGASLVWGREFGATLQQELPRLQALAESTGAAGRSLLLMIAFRYAQMGRSPAEMLSLVERGLDGGRFVEAESAESIEVTWAARVLLFTDELDRATRLMDQMVADSRRRGSVMGYATASAWRADLALRRGRVSSAEAEARSALELITAYELHFIAPYVHSFLGEA